LAALTLFRLGGADPSVEAVAQDEAMTAPADNQPPATLDEVQRYLRKIVPLLEIWDETFVPETLAQYELVRARLAALIRHTEQMDVPAPLRDLHQTLLNDVLRSVAHAYIEAITHGARGERARLLAMARSGLADFQQTLYRHFATATNAASKPM
jgi:hypothetical protein